MEGYAYLLAADGGYYKIGMSARPLDRAADFASLPWNVRLAHFIYADDAQEAERFLHRMFADRCVKGEWFRLSQSDVEWISGVMAFRDGHFNVHRPCPCMKQEAHDPENATMPERLARASCPECRYVNGPLFAKDYPNGRPVPSLLPPCR